MKWWLVLLIFLFPLLCHAQGNTPRYRILFASLQNGQSSVYSISPDGSDRKLVIADAAEPAVSQDNRYIAFVRGRDIYLANADGSDPRQVTHHGLGVAVHHPAFSAAGDRIVFAMGPVAPNPVYEIRLVNSDGSDEKTLAKDGSDPTYTPDGVQIYFARGGTIFGMFTNNMADHAYTPEPVITHGLGVSVAYPALAPNGRYTALVVSPVVPNPIPNINIITYTPNRRETTLAKNATDPAFSPDSTRLAFTRNGQIFVIDVTGRNLKQLTRGPGDSHPVWLVG